VQAALADTRVVVLNGARQTGKSTLASLVAGDHPGAEMRYLDDAATRAAAESDPTRFVRHDALLIIDEVQRVPELLLSIKDTVDRDPRPGRFLLTGSARLVALHTIPDLLPGRSETVELWPLSQGEISRTRDGLVDAVFDQGPDLAVHSSELRRDDYLARALCGGYPEAVRRADPGRRSRFFESYIADLINRQRRSSSMRHRAFKDWVFAFVAAASMAGCGGGGGVTGAAKTLTAVDIEPGSATIAAGIHQQLVATARYSDGSSEDVTAQATWSTSVSAVATVAASGTATGVAAGPAALTATYSGKSGQAALTVTGSFVQLDCLGDAACPAFQVQGDPYSAVTGNTLRGYADASIRLALDGATHYLAYSWPTLVTGVGTDTRELETHLASSADAGATWAEVGTLFRHGTSELIPGTAQQGVHSSEEISIVPAALDPAHPAVPYWISVRERYYRPLGGQLDYSTYHLRVGMAQAASPLALAGGDANEQVLLYKNNPPSFRAAMPASAVVLSDVLAGTGHADCDYPVSPALYWDGASGHLYLLIECYVAGATPEAAAAASDLVVLRATPYSGGAVRPPTAWAWEYRGSFGGQSTAALMQKNGVPAYLPNMILQPDIAVDGSTLLLVATPTIHDASGDGRTGCQVVELDSIDPPAVRMQNGQLVRRAVVNAPDLDATRYQFGQQGGSCGYAPTATGVGLAFARKHANATGLITSDFFATGVHHADPPRK
jgi:hypothetical protein